ncbi:hypothetical protein PQX77_014599 [Marasmius sp. AFHP31]|nr:hypothetical protein PQX77_014599 [Marasmius sp. AFHP31]
MLGQVALEKLGSCVSEMEASALRARKMFTRARLRHRFEEGRGGMDIGWIEGRNISSWLQQAWRSELREGHDNARYRFGGVLNERGMVTEKTLVRCDWKRTTILHVPKAVLSSKKGIPGFFYSQSPPSSILALPEPVYPLFEEPLTRFVRLSII